MCRLNLLTFLCLAQHCLDGRTTTTTTTTTYLVYYRSCHIFLFFHGELAQLRQYLVVVCDDICIRVCVRRGNLFFFVARRFCLFLFILCRWTGKKVHAFRDIRDNMYPVSFANVTLSCSKDSASCRALLRLPRTGATYYFSVAQRCRVHRNKNNNNNNNNNNKRAVIPGMLKSIQWV